MELIKHALVEEHKKHPIGQTIKPTTFAIGGQVLSIEDFKGVQPRTIKERLAKKNISVTTAWANAFHARINQTKKED